MWRTAEINIPLNWLKLSKKYSGGEKVAYPTSHSHTYQWGLAIQLWQYVLCAMVTQYLVTTEFDDDTVQAIMDEALKYEGWRRRLRWSFPDYFF